MNYRHAFHAGNFADVLKHAVLARILDYLGRKDAGYRVIDSHAGIGLYDLAADEADYVLSGEVTGKELFTVFKFKVGQFGFTFQPGVFVRLTGLKGLLQCHSGHVSLS